MDFKCTTKKVAIDVFTLRSAKDCTLLLLLLTIESIMLKMIGTLVSQ